MSKLLNELQCFEEVLRRWGDWGQALTLCNYGFLKQVCDHICAVLMCLFLRCNALTMAVRAA